LEIPIKEKTMNHGAWTREQEDFVRNNYTKMTIEEMADELCKSSLAVKLFMHRKRLAVSSVKRNIIIELLKLKFVNPEYFTPNKAFYAAVGLTSSRWWDLYHGKKKPTTEEYISIATHLNVTLLEAFESRQLCLFDTEDK
jgi:hypothetical protein